MSLTKWVVNGALARDRPDEPPRDEVLEQQKAIARAVGPREAREITEVARVVFRAHPA